MSSYMSLEMYSDTTKTTTRRSATMKSLTSALNGILDNFPSKDYTEKITTKVAAKESWPKNNSETLSTKL